MSNQSSAISNRLADSKVHAIRQPFLAAFSRARAISGAEPSMP